MQPSPEDFLETLRKNLPGLKLAEIRRIRSDFGRKLSGLLSTFPELENISYSGPMDPEDSADQVRCLRLAIEECDKQVALRGKEQDGNSPSYRTQHLSTARLTESLAAKQQQLAEIKKTDPNWRLWGNSTLPGPSERMGLQLTREIEELQVERIRRSKGQKLTISVPQAPLAEKSTESAFEHSQDFRTIQFEGETYTLTGGQAEVVRVLFEAFESGMPEVHQSRVLEEVGTSSSRLRDTFKKSPLWGKLIVPGRRKGMVQLKLASKKG